jgi:hypothetical protein
VLQHGTVVAVGSGRLLDCGVRAPMEVPFFATSDMQTQKE